MISWALVAWPVSAEAGIFFIMSRVSRVVTMSLSFFGIFNCGFLITCVEFPLATLLWAAAALPMVFVGGGKT